MDGENLKNNDDLSIVNDIDLNIDSDEQTILNEPKNLENNDEEKPQEYKEVPEPEKKPEVKEQVVFTEEAGQKQGEKSPEKTKEEILKEIGERYNSRQKKLNEAKELVGVYTQYSYSQLSKALKAEGFLHRFGFNKDSQTRITEAIKAIARKEIDIEEERKQSTEELLNKLSVEI